MNFTARPMIPRSSRRAAFTLIELLVVIAIIGILLAFLVPALGPGSGRSLDGATHQFTADLENARLIAVAERTRTRILLPMKGIDFAGGATPPPWPIDITRRGYVITSQNTSGGSWKQRGKWTRLPTGVALQLLVLPSPTPAPVTIPIDVGGTGTTTYSYSGAYIEFSPSGSTSLDPAASPATAITLGDGFVDSGDAFKGKNVNLRSTITIDPLTGSATTK